jgi:hypothetical protein
MTYFDATLEAAPVEETQSTPVIPEERFVFELIGFEKSPPDQFRPEGGIKWTWLVWYPDGERFIFQDEHYQFFRTTGLTRDGKPNFNLGTYANAWASAMLGRDLGVDANFSVSELRGKKMSAMVVWEPQKSDPKKKTIKLASLKHVPVDAPPAATNGAAKPTPAPRQGRPAADAPAVDPDRAFALKALEKRIGQAVTLETRKHLDWIAMDLSNLDTEELEAVTASVEADIKDS